MQRTNRLIAVYFAELLLALAVVSQAASPWSFLGTAPTARSGAAYWPIDTENKMIIYGGSVSDDNFTASSFLSDMYMLDFSNMSEVTSTQLSVGSSSVVSGLAGALALPTFHPGKRANPAFFVDTATNGSDTRLWIFGGYRENNVHLNDLWYYSVNTGLWRLVAGSLEASLAGMSAKAKASMWFHISTKKIHIYGGIDSSSNTVDEHFTIDISNLRDFAIFVPSYTAVNIATRPAPRSAAHTWIDGRLAYVFGGRLANGALRNDVWYLNMQNSQWTQVMAAQSNPALPEARTLSSGNQPPATASAIVVAVNGSRWVYVYTGAASLREIWTYSLDLKQWALLNNWTDATSIEYEVVPHDVWGSAGTAQGRNLITVGGAFPNGSRSDLMFSFEILCPIGYIADLSVAGNCTIPTAPADVPVSGPVIPPADAPVQVPAATPDEPPVEAPVEVPVAEPIQLPVDAPIAEPIQPPVDAPVQAPVDAPADSPAAAPLQSPVEAPIQAPIAAPVQAPVESPMGVPVEAPIDSPIQAPQAPAVRSFVLSLDMSSAGLDRSIVLALKRSIAKAFGISELELVLKNDAGVDLETLFTKRSVSANYNVVVDLVGSNAANAFDSAFSSANKTQSLSNLQTVVAADTGISVLGIELPAILDQPFAPIVQTAPLVAAPLAEATPGAEVTGAAASPIAGAVVGSILAFFLVVMIVYVATQKRAKSHQDLINKAGSSKAAPEPEVVVAEVVAINQESSSSVEETWNSSESESESGSESDSEESTSESS